MCPLLPKISPFFLIPQDIRPIPSLNGGVFSNRIFLYVNVKKNILYLNYIIFLFRELEANHNFLPTVTDYCDMVVAGQVSLTKPLMEG